MPIEPPPITYPETTKYDFEFYPNTKLPLSAWRKLANRFTARSGSVRVVLKRLLRELERECGIHTLTGPQFKDVLIAAAREAGWLTHTNAPPAIKRTTDDPKLRRCVTCKQVRSIEDFLAPPSARQAARFGWDRNAVGTEEHRGHFRTKDTPGELDAPVPLRRKVIANQCVDCRNPRVRVKNYVHTPTYRHIRNAVKRERVHLSNNKKKWGEEARSSFGNPDKIKFLRFKLLCLRTAMAEARLRRRRGVMCPPRWEQLLSKEQRVQLEKKYFDVGDWGRFTPPMFSKEEL